MESIIIKVIFGLIAIILVVNVIKFISDFFSNRKTYTQRAELRTEVNKKVKPYLGSLEKKFQNDENSGDKFGSYVFEMVKDKFPNRDEKLVEKEVCKCCSDYEGAECKEDFCLDGSGISCSKS
ncbi:MAG: hypothetical protein K0U38_04655 [Epsilonproteobacteria bacterium]|nr:hypothetical protein [Campylobacterota bacterium]